MTQRCRGASSSDSQAPAARHATSSSRPLRAVRRTWLGAARARLVLDEDLFKGTLVRAIKCADRFDEAIALVMVKAASRDQGSWTQAVEALTGTLFDTDMIGWFEQDAALGVIRPLGRLDPEAVASLAATVQSALMTLRAASTGRYSIAVEVYSPAAEGLEAWSSPDRVTGMARRTSKRTLDVAGSLALIGVLAPVFLIVSALIKLTSNGPVLFHQTRVGHRGRPFTMLKFRTMEANCDPSLHQQYVTKFIQSGAPPAVHGGGVFKLVDDPRVTRIGYLLRRSSIDELPQFWNVLRGDMSLVGPRPPLPYEVERYKAWHLRRLHEAKPGITGLWQVEGRSRTTFDEMVRLDLRYARTHSLWTDLKILLATPRAVISGKGAH